MPADIMMPRLGLLVAVVLLVLIGIVMVFSASTVEAIHAGKEAARLSREEGVEIRTVPDDRFGKVNSYHKAILSRVFAL